MKKKFNNKQEKLWNLVGVVFLNIRGPKLSYVVDISFTRVLDLVGGDSFMWKLKNQ